MKLSEILKDWPEKMEELDETEIYNLMIEHFPELCPRSNETGMDLQQGIKAIRKGKNFIKAISALTSCDREIDREALAKYIKASRSMYRWEIRDKQIGDEIQDEDEFIANSIISTMPTWLKPTERK